MYRRTEGLSVFLCVGGFTIYDDRRGHDDHQLRAPVSTLNFVSFVSFVPFVPFVPFAPFVRAAQ
jgi:hypothetical protein